MMVGGPSLEEEGKEELFEKGGEASLEGGPAGAHVEHEPQGPLRRQCAGGALLP